MLFFLSLTASASAAACRVRRRTLRGAPSWPSSAAAASPAAAAAAAAGAVSAGLLRRRLDDLRRRRPPPPAPPLPSPKSLSASSSSASSASSSSSSSSSSPAAAGARALSSTYRTKEMTCRHSGWGNAQHLFGAATHLRGQRPRPRPEELLKRRCATSLNRPTPLVRPQGKAGFLVLQQRLSSLKHCLPAHAHPMRHPNRRSGAQSQDSSQITGLFTGSAIHSASRSEWSATAAVHSAASAAGPGPVPASSTETMPAEKTQERRSLRQNGLHRRALVFVVRRL